MKGGMARICKSYNVPACRGMRVEVDGLKGRILSSDGSGLHILFDSGRKGWAHPTWRVTYFTDECSMKFGYDAPLSPTQETGGER